ncbi:MAG: SulP family inorganic anion transporter [Phycisphaerales bacterium]
MTIAHHEPSLIPQSRSLGRDLIAGSVVFLVAVPLCLGIALASGAPLQAGLISGILGGIVVGSLSGSHISVSGPAAGLAAIVLAQINALGSFQAFLLALTIAGALQLGLGLMKAGALAKFIPTNVIKGLLAAIGVLLILKQMPHLLGHDTDFEGDFSFSQTDGRNTFTALQAMLGAFLPGATLVGLVSLGVLIIWEKTPLKKTLFPGPLAAVLVGTGISLLLSARGSTWTIEATHLVAVPVLGQDGYSWSSMIQLPDFSRVTDAAVWTAAGTLAIVASIETLLNLEATDKLDPLRRFSPPNRELMAQGVGNVAAGLIGGLPMTSVIVRSSVNANAGARSRVSAIFHGALLLVSVVFLPQWLNYIPLSALAAVLVMTGWKLANPSLFASMWREGKTQFLPFAITVAAIVLTDLLVGVLLGLAVSLLFILWTNLQSGFRVIDEKHVSGLLHRVELGSQSTFLNRARLTDILAKFKRGDQVLLDARLADYVDPDILAMIREFSEETAPARGVQVSLVGFKDRYPIQDRVQFVDVSTRELQSSLTPSKVLALLKEGNERFVSGKRLSRDLVRQVNATQDGQHPMAAVLSCMDSRAPAELLFDLGIGDIFSLRLAGNVARGKVVGSLEYACKVAGSKLILVMGHTRCGAVKATCDIVAKGQDPSQIPGLDNLGAVTGPIAEAVRMESHTTHNRTSDNEEFVNRVAAINVRNTIRWILEHSPALENMVLNGDIAVVGAIYDVTSGRVDFLDGVGFAQEDLAARQPSAASRHV